MPNTARSPAMLAGGSIPQRHSAPQPQQEKPLRDGKGTHAGHDFSQIPAHDGTALVRPRDGAFDLVRDGYEQEGNKSPKQAANLPQSVRSVAGRGGGRALDFDTRASLETGLGFDLSDVRVHTHQNASTSANLIGARAYTVGNDIVFGAGHYAPGSATGRRLLVHELAHTIQQRNTSGKISESGAAQLENEADRTASDLASTGAVRPIATDFTAAPVGIQRQPAAASPAQATDPIDPGAYPGYELHLISGEYPQVPASTQIRQALIDAGIVTAQILNACQAVSVPATPNWDTPYTAFRHPTLGVVARAYGHLSGYKYPSGQEVATYGVYAFVDLSALQSAQSKAKAAAGRTGASQNGAQPIPPTSDKKTGPGEPYASGTKRVTPGTGEGKDETAIPPGSPTPTQKGEKDEQKPPQAQTPDEKLATLKALPENIKALLGGEKAFAPDRYDQLLRISEKLKALTPEDLKLYAQVANRINADLDVFEKSIEVFIKVKEQVRAHADDLKNRPPNKKELTLEEQLSTTFNKFDESKFAGMDTGQKEQLATELAAEQRNIILKHAVTHPGETVEGMAEGLVRPDKLVDEMSKDIGEALDGNANGYARAGAVASALGKDAGWVAGVAGVIAVVMLFIPGANVAELVTFAFAAGIASMSLAGVESELRLKAAGQAKDPADFKTQTQKAAVAEANFTMQAAMLALHLVAKIVARIPLPGRLQTVGNALKLARAGLLEKSGVGPAFASIKSDLLAKLKGAKPGLREALAQQTKELADIGKVIEGLSGDEFIKHLADGDPALKDLGVTPEQAKGLQQLAQTDAGKLGPDQLREQVLKGIADAPDQAGKIVDKFLADLDKTANNVQQAKDPEQLKAAIDSSGTLDPAELAKKMEADNQAYVQDRAGEQAFKGHSDADVKAAATDDPAAANEVSRRSRQSARRASVREQAKKTLGDLQTEKVQTDAKIAALEKQLSEAKSKVARLKQRVLNSADGSSERAKALEEFKAAKDALEELTEEDELGGYKEERSKQNKLEDDILASLELKRPSLWQSTKDAIKKAAKTNAAGKFLDANTGEPIESEPVYGHKYGRENRRLVLEASEKGMNQEQFTKWVNEHPEWFQTETKANNESHRFEKPGVN